MFSEHIAGVRAMLSGPRPYEVLGETWGLLSKADKKYVFAHFGEDIWRHWSEMSVAVRHTLLQETGALEKISEKTCLEIFYAHSLQCLQTLMDLGGEAVYLVEAADQAVEAAMNAARGTTGEDGAGFVLNSLSETVQDYYPHDGLGEDLQRALAFARLVLLVVENPRRAVGKYADKLYADAGFESGNLQDVFFTTLSFCESVG